ncbi:MAG: DUF4332 domain-containing protein [Planctomycetes bacterium]|nr:DUF4332 domain-containing protein [Planctomycetota bacterium]MCB9888796.1 DUF4332 domain-containing protein [Planctomycetota bacterium]
MTTYPLDELDAITPPALARLNAAGIRTSREILERCARPEGRAQVSETTGICCIDLLSWVHRADLLRVAGIGRQSAEILRHAGVDSIRDLRRRNPDRLVAAVRSVNEVRRLAKTTPSESQVRRWIDAAKVTRALVRY